MCPWDMWPQQRSLGIVVYYVYGQSNRGRERGGGIFLFLVGYFFHYFTILSYLILHRLLTNYFICSHCFSLQFPHTPACPAPLSLSNLPEGLSNLFYAVNKDNMYLEFFERKTSMSNQTLQIPISFFNNGKLTLGLEARRAFVLWVLANQTGCQNITTLWTANSL